MLRGLLSANYVVALCVAAACFLMPVGRAVSDTSVHMTSTVESNGWYRYSLRINRNGFFTDIYDVGFYPTGMAPIVEHVIPPGSSFTTNEGLPVVTWSGSWPAGRVEDLAFRSEAPYTVESAALITFLADPAVILGSPYVSQNYALFWRAPILVPSFSSAQSSTSTILRASHVFVEDPILVGLTMDTLTVEWPKPATLYIDVTEDLDSWTHVETFLHNPPTTTWTSSVPLIDLGRSFRAGLIANMHVTNLVTSMNVLSEGKEARVSVPIIAVEPSALGGVAITLETVPGAHYEVAARDFETGLPHLTAAVTATGLYTTVTMDDVGLNKPLWIDALRTD